MLFHLRIRAGWAYFTTGFQVKFGNRSRHSTYKNLNSSGRNLPFRFSKFSIPSVEIFHFVGQVPGKYFSGSGKVFFRSMKSNFQVHEKSFSGSWKVFFRSGKMYFPVCKNYFSPEQKVFFNNLKINFHCGETHFSGFEKWISSPLKVEPARVLCGCLVLPSVARVSTLKITLFFHVKTRPFGKLNSEWLRGRNA